MTFHIHTSIGAITPPPAPAPFDTHEAASEFVSTLVDLFQVEPARVIHDEYRGAYVWTRVTVVLPVIGEAAFSVDSRKGRVDGLFLNDKLVPFSSVEGGNVGQMLAQAVRAAANERDTQTVPGAADRTAAPDLQEKY